MSCNLLRSPHVYPLTLTGLGDRVHLANPSVDLNTHITDVVNAIRSGPPTYRRAIVLCYNGKRVLARARASLDAGEPYFQALAGDDWEFAELDTGHWPMLSAPADLARVLDELAR